MRWLRRNAEVIEAGAALVTALVAIAALVGVKVQLDASDMQQRAQSARDSYRSHLTLAVAHPRLAAPADVCAILTSPQAIAYEAFVDHLLYSAEQMLEIGEGWEPTFLSELAPHAEYLCQSDGPTGDTAAMIALLARFRAETCAEVPPCG